MKRLRGESELEGSGVVWSVIRALRARGAALRGLKAHHHPGRESEMERWLRGDDE